MSSDEPAAQSHCRGCGEHVTPRFARVFGDQTNTVYNCPACTRVGALQDGTAAMSGGKSE